MNRKSYNFMVVAGEESGDMRAAPLIKAVKNLYPDATFFGIAGERCRLEGVELICDISKLAVMGFVEVIRNLPRIKRIFDLAVRTARERKPDAVILVDYPGFNLRLAGELKKLGIKVFYYVSPQVWAWKAERVKIIKKVVDRMMVLFPFEKEFYAKHGFTADFVGHPLVDEVRASKSRLAFISETTLDPAEKIIGILPGSREKEIVQHLPVMLKAATIIKKNAPGTQFLLLRAKNLPESLFEQAIKNSDVPLCVSTDYYNALNASDLCITASGTATLETALLEKPMVVIYKTAWLTSVIVRLLIRIPYVSLVNIVAGKKVVPELLQNDASPEKISGEMISYLKDALKCQNVSREMRAVRTRLGATGASQRAAKVIRDGLSRQ